MPKEEIKREVEKELTGKDCEPSQLTYFKAYESQSPIIEQAIGTAAVMLGSDKSRGYCLEMVCADFLAGANCDEGNPEIQLQSISRCYKFLRLPQQEAFLSEISRMPYEKASPQDPPTAPRSKELSQTTAADPRSRRLALPGLRSHATPTGAPPTTPEAFRQR